jgi:hypothetical protein
MPTVPYWLLVVLLLAVYLVGRRHGIRYATRALAARVDALERRIRESGIVPLDTMAVIRDVQRRAALHLDASRAKPDA